MRYPSTISPVPGLVAPAHPWLLHSFIARRKRDRVTDDAAESDQLVLTTTREGTAVLVAVAGELDAHSVPSLQALTARLISDGFVRFALDLSQTTFIDSAGLRALIELQATVQENSDGKLVLQAPADGVTRLLRIAGLGDHFSVT
jgi:anti-sigma B factor antagonist